MSEIELVNRLRASAKAIRSDKGPELIEAADAIEALTAALINSEECLATLLKDYENGGADLILSEIRAALRKVRP